MISLEDKQAILDLCASTQRRQDKPQISNGCSWAMRWGSVRQMSDTST